MLAQVYYITRKELRKVLEPTEEGWAVGSLRKALATGSSSGPAGPLQGSMPGMCEAHQQEQFDGDSEGHSEGPSAREASRPQLVLVVFLPGHWTMTQPQPWTVRSRRLRLVS